MEKVCSFRNKISKIREMRIYLTFGFVGFEVVNKRMKNLFKGSRFRIFEFYLVGMKSINPLQVNQILPVTIHIG